MQMHTMRKVHHVGLHRVTEMSVDAEESCATEGGQLHEWQRHQGRDDIPRVSPRIPRARRKVGAFWVVVLIALASAGVLLSVHFGVKP